MLLRRKGQSTAEYAIIIGVVVGAVMAAGTFLRGGIEGKVRDMTNQYMAQGSNATMNFATPIMQSSMTTTSAQASNTAMTDGVTKTSITRGGGTAAAAEISGNTTRKGTTTYFK